VARDEQDGRGETADNRRMNEERIAREERAERRIKDAIANPKMGNKAVAEGCLAWLLTRGKVGREWMVANW
jgi:hypothetical protein